MVYCKEDEKDKSNKELIISVKVIPNFEKIGKDLTDEQIREIIWPKIKEVNKKLTSYKAIKNLGCDEADIFCKKFVPEYEKTLDELN